MLSAIIFMPLMTGFIVLMIPRSRPALARRIALSGALVTLALALALWAGYDRGAAGLQWRLQAPWIPLVNAGYAIAVDGISLSLVILTALLSVLVLIYVLPARERTRAHAFLFLLMETGLIGLFCAQDLLLFYLFFEVALVPMYFVIGIWGHERRRYAAIKFFLYTRIGSLAMLLSFLGLYLSMTPRTFSLPAIIAAQPLAGRSTAAALVLAGLVIGFGVKLPIFPLHNWLPDAHVEAPTEGSVILAGLLLKMGGYGFIRIMLPTVGGAVRHYAWFFLVVALVSILYGALAALGQKDFKRLIAYTSVNHMGFVLLGVAVWAFSENPGIRQLALNGATLQMISHGLLTGAMFFMVGILQIRAQTRDLTRLGGLLQKAPACSGLLGVLAFGSLGLPGLSGFMAEFEVIGAILAVKLWAAVLAVLGIVLVTAVYIKVLIAVIMGEAHGRAGAAADLGGREALAVAPMALASLLIGIFPYPILRLIETGTALLVRLGL